MLSVSFRLFNKEKKSKLNLWLNLLREILVSITSFLLWKRLWKETFSPFTIKEKKKKKGDQAPMVGQKRKGIKVRPLDRVFFSFFFIVNNRWEPSSIPSITSLRAYVRTYQIKEKECADSSKEGIKNDRRRFPFL